MKYFTLMRNVIDRSVKIVDNATDIKKKRDLHNMQMSSKERKTKSLSETDILIGFRNYINAFVT